MAKLIVVTREQQEKGRADHERLLAEDPLWQEEIREMQRQFAEEKSRRDSEHRAQQAEAGTQKKQETK